MGGCKTRTVQTRAVREMACVHDKPQSSILNPQTSILNPQYYSSWFSVGTGVFVFVGIAVGGEVLDGVGVSRKSGLRVRVMVGTKVLVGGGGLVKVALGSCGAEVGGRTPGVVGVRVGVRVAVRVAVAEPG